MLVSVSLTVFLQFVFTYAPFMQIVFETRPVASDNGAIVVGIGVALLLFPETEKWVRGRLP